MSADLAVTPIRSHRVRVELPYRIKVRAPHGHSSTNGYCYRYFETFDEAAYFEGRVGYPEVEYGAAFAYRDCRHHWVADKTGLIDTCQICGEERA